MSEQQAPDEMDRDELETEVAEIRDEMAAMDDQMRQLQNDMAFVKKALRTLTDADLGDEMGITNLPDYAAQTRDEIDDLKTATESHAEQLSAVRDVGSEKTGKDEKVAAIAAFATKKANSRREKVLVKPDEVQGCTGVSRRYAYDLIDSIGDDDSLEWGTVRKPTNVPTGSGRTHKAKGLAVDCGVLRDSSHGDGSVNNLTTDSEREGD